MIGNLLAFVAGALATFSLDFGAIRLINHLEGMRPETKAEERRSFTIGDKYFLPLASGLEAVIVRTNSLFFETHLWLVGLAFIGLAYGIIDQWQNYRRDPIFARKVAQWYHATVASTVMVFVIVAPFITLALRLQPLWASAMAVASVVGWAACAISDLHNQRVNSAAMLRRRG